MSQAKLLATLDGLAHTKALVLGDFILDQYTWGNAERISQEAPVILLRADRREVRLGGAANVCQMLRGLEASVTCAGVVGNDIQGEKIRTLLDELDVRNEMLIADTSRPTTNKERFIGRAANRHPHQILRVDSEERHAISNEIEEELRRQIIAEIPHHDVVIISDYDKGVCRPSLLRVVIDAARAARIPVVVDPVRGSDYSKYCGATTMTPNRSEAEAATGLTIQTEDDAFEAGRVLCRQLELDMAIVTLDRDGMALVHKNGKAQRYETKARDVYDITGAGDMVLATISVCLSAGTSPEDAVRLANVAAGLEVEHVGVAVVHREEIRKQLITEGAPGAGKIVEFGGLAELSLACRERGKNIVFTNGCFDLLHVGHVTYLADAARMGDVLVVGVNSDTSVSALKGPKRPVISQQNRAAILAALECVDHVVVFDELTPIEVIKKLRPHVLVKGGDYQPEQIVGRDIVHSYGGRVVVTSIVEGVSTTKILRQSAA